MRATRILQELGQSIWLDNISRDLLDSGRLEYYIRELSVTGLTSNPTIFERAFKSSSAYEGAILREAVSGKSPKAIYVAPLPAPFTVNTMPEDALNALTQSTAVKEPLLMNSKDCERVLAEFIDAGIDLDGLAADLQDAGTKSVVNSWNVLIAVLESKAAVLNKGRTLRPTS